MFVPGCSAVPSRDPPDSARWQAASTGKRGKGSCSSAPSQEKSLVGVRLPWLCCCVALESGREGRSTVKEWASGWLGQAEHVGL